MKKFAVFSFRNKMDKLKLAFLLDLFFAFVIAAIVIAAGVGAAAVAAIAVAIVAADLYLQPTAASSLLQLHIHNPW